MSLPNDLPAPEADGAAGHLPGMRVAHIELPTELAGRLELPFEILSDPGHELARALDLPTFTVGEQRLYKRLTLIIADGGIEHVFYPIFPPDEHAAQVLGWLAEHAPG
jgi:peroxiredoxin